MSGERGCGDGPTPMCDSAVLPYFHGCLAFLHRHIPPQSSLSHPLGPSLHRQQQPSPWDCCTIPKLQLPAAAPSRGPASLLGGWYGCGKGCLILIPFRLPQISCFILILKYFSSDPDTCPDLGIGPLLHFPNPLRAGSLLLIGPVPLSYQVICGPIYSFLVVRYSFLFSSGVLQALLCLKVFSSRFHIHLLLHHLIPTQKAS